MTLGVPNGHGQKKGATAKDHRRAPETAVQSHRSGMCEHRSGARRRDRQLSGWANGHRFRVRFKNKLEAIDRLTGRFIRDDFVGSTRIYRPTILALLLSDSTKAHYQLSTIDKIIRFLAGVFEDDGQRQATAAEISAATQIPLTDVYEALCHIRELGLAGGWNSDIPNRPDWYLLPGDGLLQRSNLSLVLEQQLDWVEQDVRARDTLWSDRDSGETDESLAALWKWISIPTFTYCLGMWIRMQTDDFALVRIVVQDVESAKLFGLFAAPFVILDIVIAGRYGRRSRYRPIAARVPPILENGSASELGSRIQLATILGILTIQAGSQVHFLRKVLNGAVYSSGELFATGPREMIAKFRLDSLLSNDYQFGHPDGPTYFPGLETWFWLVVVGILLATFINYLFRSLRITQPKRHSGSFGIEVGALSAGSSSAACLPPFARISGRCVVWLITQSQV